jgi:hypothetical protein
VRSGLSLRVALALATIQSVRVGEDIELDDERDDEHVYVVRNNTSWLRDGRALVARPDKPWEDGRRRIKPRHKKRRSK